MSPYKDPAAKRARKARTVRVIDIIGNQQVRKMCGGITRHTLIAWRRDQGFPAPIRRIPGPGPSAVELWDRSEVRAWLKERERT